MGVSASEQFSQAMAYVHLALLAKIADCLDAKPEGSLGHQLLAAIVKTVQDRIACMRHSHFVMLSVGGEGQQGRQGVHRHVAIPVGRCVFPSLGEVRCNIECNPTRQGRWR